MSRLKSVNACNHSLQNVLSFSFPYKNIKIKIQRTTILPVVLYGCETLSFTPREEHRLTMFGNRVLRKILGPKRDNVVGEWRSGGDSQFVLLTNIIHVIKSRQMRWMEQCATCGKQET